MAGMPFSPCDTTDGASTCSDASVGVLRAVFGPVIDALSQGNDPETVTASSNVLASMFVQYNSGLLILASLFVSYITIVGVANTANEGEAMGKAWSSLWTPLRIVFGGGVLLPASSGYSIIQIIVLTIGLWGIGFANGVFKAGVENGIVNGSLSSVSSQLGFGSGAKPNPNYPLYDIRQFGQAYLASSWCARSLNAIYGSVDQPTAVQALSTPDSNVDDGIGRQSATYLIKDRNRATNLGGGTPICGSIKVYSFSVPTELITTPTSTGSIFDPATITSNKAAMQAVRHATLNAKIIAMNKVMADIDAWVNTWPTDITKNGWDTVKSDRFNLIINQAQNALTQNLTSQMANDTTLQKIMGKYVEDVTEDGWAMAGGFYQRLSGIRQEMGAMFAEPVAIATQPNLNMLPKDAAGRLALNTYQTVYQAIISKSLDGSSYKQPVTPNASDIKAALAPASLDDLNVDTLGSRGDSIMSNFIGWGMERVTATLIGTDGDVDAISRIKTTGDVLALMQASAITTNRIVHTALSGAKAVAAGVGSVSFFGTSVDATPLADTLLEWVVYNFLKPLVEVASWVGILAFYFGVFLPSLPYTIFIIAVVGWVLGVLQSVVAAPLWALTHMTPERSFVGSQTQGYLMLLSLFARPVLIVFGLFAAMAIANPILLYISKAFWAMHAANVTSAESLGWFVEFFQWRNWLIMYGLLLLPVIYMIFGLSQTLPDVVLKWIGIGIDSMGSTQATSEMRSNTEKFGPSSLGGGSGGTKPIPGGGTSGLRDDSGNNDGGDRGGRKGGGAPLNIGPQGVAPNMAGESLGGASSSESSTRPDSRDGESLMLGPRGGVLPETSANPAELDGKNPSSEVKKLNRQDRNANDDKPIMS
ncbi:Integral membrane protein [Pseudomonas savastanoi pv. glycinea]|nr:DotA/TraY family protein [Pseudomonas savastanoi]KPX37848.1 Integral membrane protein [Pseudomonas savastanoi pv. glycinea]PYD22825.1 hypothetical protein DND36_11625 [Pseudomonas savastanoi pv. glycinea]RMQ16037.1 Integral membrane protein [Pseudomonas savastanoi pv. glycinea]RMQ47462.1 Integral membrane protein [Pseudomonas savastanoi pv. glycinea]